MYEQALLLCESLKIKEFISLQTHSSKCEKNESPLQIIPIFYERYMLEKYFEMTWICNVCTEKNHVSEKGVLVIDDGMRAYVANEDDASTEDPLKKVKEEMIGLCYACFNGKYNECENKVKENISHLNEIHVG